MPLFHPRIIGRITDNAPEELPEEHAEVIQNWAATIQSRAIFQQSEVSVHGHFTQRILIGVLGYTGLMTARNGRYNRSAPSVRVQSTLPLGISQLKIVMSLHRSS